MPNPHLITRNILNQFCSCLFLLIATSCGKEAASPGDNSLANTAPFVTLTVASNITATTALVNCEVNSDGGAAVTARGFCWGKTSKPTLADNKSVDGTGTGKFSTTITGLSAGTTYYARAYATNSVGTTYGLETSFPTEGSFSTSGVTSITVNSAVGGGYTPVDPTITARGICWSTKPEPTYTDAKTTEAPGAGNFVSTMTGLNGGTTYYVKAYAVRATGVSLAANTVTFTTPAGIPVLTTATPTAVRSFSATTGGTFTFSNGTITERGLCWSLTSNPNTSDFKVKLGTGDEPFSGSMSNLNQNATYYVRAYAINSAGTGYGPQQTVNTMPTVTDADGNIYETVKIGTQIWMGSNLRTKKYQNGDPVSTTANPRQPNVGSSIFPLYQWPVNGDEANVDVYGRLYTWNAVKDARQIAPAGWHVASDDDWKQLSTFVGVNAGELLKEPGQSHWNGSGAPSGAGGTTNPYGFTAVGSGRRLGDDTIIFTYLGYFAYWWTTTPYDFSAGVTGGRAWYAEAASKKLGQDVGQAFEGMAVRCVKN